MYFEESFIFFPMRYPRGDWNPGLPNVEDARFTAADGTALHGWFLESPQPRAVILIAHGNGGNITHRLELLVGLQRLGTSVLTFDYRGYGRSAGAPNEAGVLADARAARRWLAERTGVDEADIVLVGESLGGGVQVDLAAADGARGLILLDTFDTLAAVGAYHYPWLPVKLLLRTRFDSLGKIGQYHGPLLQVHGDRDTIIPIAHAERLFAAANQPKQFVTIRGGDHNAHAEEKTFQAIGRLLSTIPLPIPEPDKAGRD